MLSNFTINWGIAPIMYRHFYFIFVSVFTFIMWSKYAFANGNTNLLKKQSQVPMTLFVLFMILFIGFRCVNASDMAAYRIQYLRKVNLLFDDFSFQTEWLWQRFATICQALGFSEWIWFALITAGYIGCMLYTCKKMLWENVSLAMLFMMTSYPFFAYGTNTIRNGLACAIILMAMSIFLMNNKQYSWIAFLLCFAAFGIHRSVVIPIFAFGMSFFIIRRIRFGLIIWISSVLLSLAVGDYLMIFFTIFDDSRVEAYFNGTSNVSLFSHTGFRWDFLLYSAVPVFVAWYAAEYKRVNDKIFNILGNTYILANSVWIICIRASYSDRFAYLSWFLYPLVLAYAFIRLPLLRNQDKAVAWVLLAHLSFSLVLFYVFGK